MLLLLLPGGVCLGCTLAQQLKSKQHADDAVTVM
jgi:hypothetical protein